MALKVLQIVSAAALVVIVILVIPVLLRLRRTIEEVGRIVSENEPQAINLIRKAQVTLDGVNRELANIEDVTRDTKVLIEKAGEASDAIDRAIKSPLTRIGLFASGATVTGIAVKRRLRKRLKGKK